jgi:tetratricopeptide (TPR) repeat protein
MAGEDELEQARGHVRRAAAASDLGNYAEAAKEYEAAYMKTSDANLLVNVGQAWQLAGERQKALTAFRSCVRIAPNGGQRAVCEAKIRELEDQRMSQPTAAPLVGTMAPPMMVAAPPPPAPYAVPPPPAATFATSHDGATAVAEPCPACSRWPIWIAVGAVVVAGVVVGVLYARQDTDLAMPTTTFGAKRF